MATERERDEAGALLKRLEKKRKLFGFLRRHRHKLVDDEFQAELEAMHRGTGAGKEPVPPGQMAMALLLQGYLVLSDWDAVETSVIGSPALRRGLDRPRASRCRGVWVATSFRETRQRSGRTIVYGPGEGGAANPFGLMEFATITASLPDGTALEPVARTTRFDPHGRVASVTDSTGRAETFTYDSLGRLRSRVIAGSPGQTWTYGYTHGDNRLVLEEKLAETGSPPRRRTTTACWPRRRSRSATARPAPVVTRTRTGGSRR